MIQYTLHSAVELLTIKAWQVYPLPQPPRRATLHDSPTKLQFTFNRKSQNAGSILGILAYLLDYKGSF